MQIASIGIDLGKNTFHLVALDEHSKVVIRQKFTRKQLLAYTANLPNAQIGIEACSGAHSIGATLRDQAHDVRLIPAQFVPFLKSNKNDFLDAEAIAEAVVRQNTTTQIPNWLSKAFLTSMGLAAILLGIFAHVSR